MKRADRVPADKTRQTAGLSKALARYPSAGPQRAPETGKRAEHHRGARVGQGPRHRNEGPQPVAAELVAKFKAATGPQGTRHAPLASPMGFCSHADERMITRGKNMA